MHPKESAFQLFAVSSTIVASLMLLWLVLSGASGVSAQADHILTSPLPTPDVAGKVILERRTSNAGTQVCLDGDCVITSDDGSYGFDEVMPGTYTVTASHPSYLRSWRAVSFTEESILLPDVTLLGGDVNQDNHIDLTDANLIGQAFNSTPEDASWDERADITNDGTVNILDMVAVQFNWDKTAPGPWPTITAR